MRVFKLHCESNKCVYCQAGHTPQPEMTCMYDLGSSKRKKRTKKVPPTGIRTQTPWLTSPGSLHSDYMEGVNW